MQSYVAAISVSVVYVLRNRYCSKELHLHDNGHYLRLALCCCDKVDGSCTATVYFVFKRWLLVVLTPGDHPSSSLPMKSVVASRLTRPTTRILHLLIDNLTYHEHLNELGLFVCLTRYKTMRVINNWSNQHIER